MRKVRGNLGRHAAAKEAAIAAGGVEEWSLFADQSTEYESF